MVPMSNHVFFWLLPAFGAAFLGSQLYTGRIPLYWNPRGWVIIEKEQDEGRYWLFIIAQFLLVLILAGQALSK